MYNTSCVYDEKNIAQYTGYSTVAAWIAHSLVIVCIRYTLFTHRGFCHFFVRCHLGENTVQEFFHQIGLMILYRQWFNHFTSKPKCMSGSSDPGITIVNPTEISAMYGYIT